MDTSQGNILIATYGTMSTGVSIKNINEVFLASSYKSRQKVIQSIGRGLRKSTTKSKVRTWDFVDDICDTRDGSTFMNKLYQQWLHRCKYYEEEKYPNKIVYHELEPTVKMQFI